MIITDIVKDKKHQARVVLDSGETVLLDLDLFSEVPLKKGDEITAEKLIELNEKSEFLRAKSRALWCLDRAPYSEKGLYDKLITARFSPKTAAAVIKRLKELGLIDDVRYAGRLCEYFKEKGLSRRETFHKMLLKGLPKEIVNDALLGCEIDEPSQIKILISKKYKNKMESKEDTQKVYASLIRKGFSYSAVKEALKNYTEDTDWEE
jgi:regulatory protein